MKKRILLSLLIPCLIVVQTAAHQEPELDRLYQKLKQHVKEKEPGWQHRRGELIQGSSGVLVQWWFFPNRTVKVSIIPRDSTHEAREKMQLFVNEEREIEELKGLGDEAYTWGYAGTNVIFRKGRHTIYVSTTANIDADQDAIMMNPAQKTERMKSEMRHWTRVFAGHVTKALDEQ